MIIARTACRLQDKTQCSAAAMAVRAHCASGLRVIFVCVKMAGILRKKKQGRARDL